MTVFLWGFVLFVRQKYTPEKIKSVCAAVYFRSPRRICLHAFSFHSISAHLCEYFKYLHVLNILHESMHALMGLCV